MAIWDSADLLARLRTVTRRPATDQELTTAKGYEFLSDAQREVIGTVANRVPWAMYGAPALMVTADGGVTYTLNPSTNEWVGLIEVYPDNRPFAQPLKEGPLWAGWADYTREGEGKIRMAGSRARLFSGGPYIRYVAKPGIIDAGTAPVLKPDEALAAVVQLAAAKWAKTGGLRDPAPYEDEYLAILFGDESLHRDGIIPSLLRQEGHGPGHRAGWWRSADLGRLP